MQPWADAVIDGLLPILIRRIPIRKKGIIGIAATSVMDGVFLETLSEDDLMLAEDCLIFDRVIGSACAEGCILVFLFGIVLISWDIRENGSLELWDGGPRLEGWLPILVCIFGILGFAYGAVN